MLIGQKNIFRLLILILIFAAEMVQAQPQRAYERGLEELYNGNTTRALDIWYNAYDGTEGVDARIGFEFIRVVTEERMRDYYEQATELYYKALTESAGIDSRVVMRQEINRLRAITGEGIYRQWTTWWEGNNERLGSDMRGFWIQQDPTPSRLSNERLIEHWKRIAESKQRFTRNSNTPYGTDDRALIYVRYGEPDRTKNGIFTLQSFNIRSWLQRQLNPYQIQSQSSDLNQETDTQTVEDLQMIDRLQDAIYEFHRYPEYEIWFYDEIATEGGQSIPYVFGTDMRTNDFRLQSTIEDFIPSRAYSPERVRENEGVEFTRAGITPALMLQLLYYEQLAQVDPFFNDRLNELQDNVLEQGLEAFQGMDLAFKSESEELINQRSIRAPVEFSMYSEQIVKIPLEVYQYRFLDEDLNPYMLAYLESSAQEAFLIDYHRNQSQDERNIELRNGENVFNSFSNYELIHSLQEYSSDWNIVQKQDHLPELLLHRSDSARVPSRSLFRINHTERKNLSASVELINYEPETSRDYESPFSEALRGLGSIQFRVPEPLVNQPDSLEMADLVLGYESEEMNTEPFNFVVANDGVVPFEKTLVLHFEVYNLKRREDITRFTNFELTYQIIPVDEFEEDENEEATFVLTLNFINENQTVVEDLEIETADLNPGLYDLKVQVIDTETNRQKERTVRFEVVE